MPKVTIVIADGADGIELSAHCDTPPGNAPTAAVQLAAQMLAVPIALSEGLQAIAFPDPSLN